MAQDNSLKVLTHVLGYISSWLGPLILLLAIDDEEVKKHARKALNWQISLIIYGIICFILFLVFIGIFMLVALVIMDLVFCIIAAVKAGNDELWDYPLAIPFLK
ncbi:MAG: DUF4870 domain-containing protein [Candidatus Woesearchaeota archaeon]